MTTTTLTYCPGCTYHAENGCEPNNLQAATAEMQAEHLRLKTEKTELQKRQRSERAIAPSGTYTFATLEVLASTYEDIRSRLEMASHDHAIDHENERIDMHGLAIVPMRLPARLTPSSLGTTMKSYRHYKGGLYTLLLVARGSEDRSELLAVYVSHKTQQIWVRPWAMFTEIIPWNDGVRRPRFVEMVSEETAPWLAASSDDEDETP